MWTGHVVSDLVTKPPVLATQDAWNAYILANGRNKFIGGGRFHGNFAQSIPPGVGVGGSRRRRWAVVQDDEEEEGGEAHMDAMDTNDVGVREGVEAPVADVPSGSRG